MTEHVLVVGAGQMGAGIAQVAAAAGMRVTLVDVGGAARARLHGHRGSLAKLAAKGQRDDRMPCWRASRPRRRPQPAADADLAIEAATEDVELKLALFRQLDAALDAGAVLASNTSSIPIGRLAAATQRPARSAGCTS